MWDWRTIKQFHQTATIWSLMKLFGTSYCLHSKTKTKTSCPKVQLFCTHCFSFRWIAVIKTETLVLLQCKNKTVSTVKFIVLYLLKYSGIHMYWFTHFAWVSTAVPFLLLQGWCCCHLFLLFSYTPWRVHPVRKVGIWRPLWSALTQ